MNMNGTRYLNVNKSSFRDLKSVVFITILKIFVKKNCNLLLVEKLLLIYAKRKKYKKVIVVFVDIAILNKYGINVN